MLVTFIETNKLFYYEISRNSRVIYSESVLRKGVVQCATPSYERDVSQRMRNYNFLWQEHFTTKLSSIYDLQAVLWSKYYGKT